MDGDLLADTEGPAAEAPDGPTHAVLNGAGDHTPAPRVDRDHMKGRDHPEAAEQQADHRLGTVTRTNEEDHIED